MTVASHAESQRDTLPVCRSAHRLLLQCSGRDQSWIFDRLSRDPAGAVVKLHHQSLLAGRRVRRRLPGGLSGKENPHVHALPPRGYCGQVRACATFCSVHVHFVEEICNHTCWVTGLVCVLNCASLQPNRFSSCPAATSCNMCMWVCHTRLAWLVSCVFKESLRHIAFSQVLWGLLAVATCVITTLL